MVYKEICTSPVLRLECLFRRYIFYTQTSSLFSIEQWLDLISFFVLSKKVIQFDAKKFSFIFFGSIHFAKKLFLVL